MMTKESIDRKAGGRKPSSTTSNIDAEKQFCEAAAQCGLIIENLIADGEIHRCDVEGKNGKGDGAYCLHIDDSIPAGWFQNHKDGVGVHRWHARTGQKLTDAEVAAHRAKVRAQQAQREAELEKEHVRMAARATALVENNRDADDLHPYFVRKKIKAPRGIKHSATPVAISPWRNSAPDVVIVPACDIDGTLWNVQVIDAHGRKDFLKGCRKAGCFFVIGKTGAVFTTAGLNPNGLNLIVEGLATGATCFEAMDVPVIVAFDAGNLLPVALALRDRYPNARFIVCGDDDWQTKDGSGKLTNPGKSYAMKAARAIGAELAFPVFSPSHHREAKETDFNDLHQVEGLGAVRAGIEAAEPAQKKAEREARPVNADLVEKIEAAILALAALSETAYETVRKEEAKQLEVDARFLDRKVKEARKAAAAAAAPDSAEKAKKRPAIIQTLEPWPEAVEGPELMDELPKHLRAMSS